MKKLIRRLKMWIYWRKNYSTEGSLYELAVLFGIKAPFSFRVMTPLNIFVDNVNRKEG